MQIVKDKLCTGCGICDGVCPVKAINMIIDKYGIYSPQINEEKCVDCGLCRKVCPGIGIDYKYYMMKLHGSLPRNPAIGPYIKSYAGYANDKEILDKSQSGGFVSALLLHGLKNNLFDGAVVTSWHQNDPFKPNVYIARNRKQVLNAVGSKYNPIPVAAITKELMELKGRYAFVGTSCQIQGMRKAEDNVKGFSNKIALYVGLHCLKVFNYHYHDQILYKIKKKKSEISCFRFRDKEWRGWPCDMLLSTMSGEKINLTGSFSKIQARSYFSNWRCQLCFDKFNEFSDVSCGDCRIAVHYGKETISEAYYREIGKSDIVVRTKRGKEIVDDLVDNAVLVVEKSDIQDLIKSVEVAGKKLGLSEAMRFAKMIGVKSPEYGVQFSISADKTGLKRKLLYLSSPVVAGHYYICHSLMRFGLFRQILKLTPHSILGKLASMRDMFSDSVKNRRRTDIEITIQGKEAE